MKRFLVVVLLLLGGVAVLGKVLSGDAQPMQLAQPVLIEIPAGTGVRTIAQKLTDAGLLRSPYPFLAWHYARLSRAKLKAGEYRFEGDVDFRDVHGKIARGEIYYHPVSIPEGYTMYDIAAAVERSGLTTAKAFLDAARNPKLIADLAPGAQSLEGFLFPDTYLFQRHTTPAEMTATMVARFRKVYKDVAKDNAQTLQVVTLASLVEKETGKASERPLVAGVFHNRLMTGMPLQCDPTVVYAALLAGAYRGTIYASDLKRASPYNTYVTRGLPPGPIANPGRASLEAAASPALTNFMFFVADTGGGHVFSRTLSEHNRHVEEYRKKTSAHAHG